MMTPKEKAIELMIRYGTEVPSLYKGFSCKHAVLIAVDEIINEYDRYLQSCNTNDLAIKYWEEVKQEIEKL